MIEFAVRTPTPRTVSLVGARCPHHTWITSQAITLDVVKSVGAVIGAVFDRTTSVCRRVAGERDALNSVSDRVE